MKFSTAVAVAAAVAGAQAASNVTYTTEVLTAYTTYCPEPTKITHGGVTYTVTKATTLTITDCPCTVTKPVLTSTVSVCHDCVVPTVKPSGPFNNGTTPTTAKPPVSSATATGTISKPPPFTGAASQATAAGGFAAILLGAVAYLL